MPTDQPTLPMCSLQIQIPFVAMKPQVIRLTTSTRGTNLHTGRTSLSEAGKHLLIQLAAVLKWLYHVSEMVPGRISWVIRSWLIPLTVMATSSVSPSRVAKHLRGPALWRPLSKNPHYTAGQPAIECYLPCLLGQLRAHTSTFIRVFFNVRLLALA